MPEDEEKIIVDTLFENELLESKSLPLDLELFNTNLCPSNDYGLWPSNIGNELVRILLERSPVQVRNHNFPVINARKISIAYFTRQLTNGKQFKRECLVYSIVKSSVFCFCCKIFGTALSNLSDVNSFSDCQHLS